MSKKKIPFLNAAPVTEPAYIPTDEDLAEAIKCVPPQPEE